MSEPLVAPQSDDEVRKLARDGGIEFLFAQFVDMHGKPNAKLVPAHHLDDLLDRRRGLRRLRGRRHRPGPARPRPHRDARRAQLHAAAVAPGRRALRLRRDGRGRGVALLPAHDPAPPARRAPRRWATSSASAPSSSTSSCAGARTARSRSPTRSTPSSSPVTTCARLTRNLDFVSTVARNVTALGWDNYATDHEDANGQFEQNFEFDDALVTCDRAIFFRYMVEALAQERGLIATFMPKPFAHLTGNGCHFHMSLWKDGENLFDADPSDDPRGLGLSRARLPVHRRAQGARQGLHRGDRADGDLLQAAGRRRADERRDVGAGLRQLRLQQPHADAAHPGPRAHRGPHRRRLVQPLPRPPPPCSRPASTASSAGSTRASPTR